MLGLVGFASQGKQVARPVKGIAHVTFVITLGEQGPLSAVSDALGQLSHIGPVTSPKTSEL